MLLTSSVHGALGDLLNIFEELGLGGARVPQEQHVDVAAQAVRSGRVLLLAAEQRQRDAGLDVQVAVDGWRDGLADPLACADLCLWLSCGREARCATSNVGNVSSQHTTTAKTQLIGPALTAEAGR